MLFTLSHFKERCLAKRVQPLRTIGTVDKAALLGAKAPHRFSNDKKNGISLRRGCCSNPPTTFLPRWCCSNPPTTFLPRWCCSNPPTTWTRRGRETIETASFYFCCCVLGRRPPTIRRLITSSNHNPLFAIVVPCLPLPC